MPCANVAPRPAAGERDCFLIHALCLSLKVPGEFPRPRKTLALTLALPPNLCKKVQEIFNGWKRTSGTMHTRKCMVPLGNLHGWTRASAWFRSPKCMVPLPALHGWTQKDRFWHQKVMLAIHRKSIAQPSRQEVLPPPLKLRRTSRVLILRQVQHPRHTDEDVNTIGETAKPANFGKRISPLVSENAI